jgi:hypothetical protein
MRPHDDRHKFFVRKASGVFGMDREEMSRKHHPSLDTEET